MNNKKIRLTAVIAAALLSMSLLSIAGLQQQRASATPIEEQDLVETEQSIEETQQIQLDSLTEEQRTVGNSEYTSRWGPVATIEPDKVAVLLADCRPGEMAISGEVLFASEFIYMLESFALGFSGDTELTSWLTIVKNVHSEESKQAAGGVMCVGESTGTDTNDVDEIDVSVRVAAQDAINKIIVEGGDTINIKNIVNIVQNITQIVNIVNNQNGSNNTIINAINQTATQVINTNQTNNIEVIANQTLAAVVEQEEPPTSNTTVTTTPEPTETPRAPTEPDTNTTETIETPEILEPEETPPEPTEPIAPTEPETPEEEEPAAPEEEEPTDDGGDAEPEAPGDFEDEPTEFTTESGNVVAVDPEEDGGDGDADGT